MSISFGQWPLSQPFSISRYTFTQSLTATVELIDSDGCRGRGECEPHEHDQALARAMVEDAGVSLDDGSRPEWLDGLDRRSLGDRMRRSPVRNAIDCALWDLDAKRSGRAAYELAGLPWQPLPVMSTVGIDTPAAMGTTAASFAGAGWVKVKLGGKDGLDEERLEAVAAALPGVPILVDPNGGWDPAMLIRMLPLAARLGVRIIEQPMLPSLNAAMPAPPSDLVFCADESCLDRSSLRDVRRHFQAINIKLDKTGGLTEALALREEAEGLGLGVMVGMNSGTSLAVAPSFLLAQGLDVVDLEVGFLRADRDDPIRIVDHVMQLPERTLWG